MPELQPNRPLNATVERNYDAYMGVRPENNKMYSYYCYYNPEGFLEIDTRHTSDRSTAPINLCSPTNPRIFKLPKINLSAYPSESIRNN